MQSLDFCPQLKLLYTTRDAVGRSGKTVGGSGSLSTVNNVFAIRALMLELKPERTLEIGMACGGSALVFAQTHKDLGRLPEGQHTAIDAYQSRHWDDSGRLTLERAELQGYVDFHEELSQNVLPKLADRKYGMIYVDGSHQFEDVLMDFVFCHEILEVGGIILFDDSADPDVAKVLRFIEANYQGIYERVSTVNYHDGFKSRIRYRIASFLRWNQLTVYRKLKDGRREWNEPLRRF